MIAVRAGRLWAWLVVGGCLPACSSSGERANADTQFESARGRPAHPIEIGSADHEPAPDPSIDVQPIDLRELPPAQPPPPPPEPAGPPEFVGEPKLLVAGDEGLREFDLDGELLRTLETEPCLAPRVLPNSDILFLRPATSKGYELVLRTAAGALRSLATLPYYYDEETCLVVDADCESCTTLEPVYPEEFAIDVDAGEACFSLQDRNDNMADVGLRVTVNLETGKVEHELEFSSCHGHSSFHSCGHLWRDTPRAGPPLASTPAFPYDFVEPGMGDDPAVIVHAGRKPLTVCDPERETACANENTRSPAGRFVLLDGVLEEGCYFHSDQIVFDRRDGSLHAIVFDERWQMVRIDRDDVMAGGPGWLSVVDSSDVRWLPRDRLWIDGLLFDLPRRRIHAIGGDLALRLDYRL